MCLAWTYRPGQGVGVGPIHPFWMTGVYLCVELWTYALEILVGLLGTRIPQLLQGSVSNRF